MNIIYQTGILTSIVLSIYGNDDNNASILFRPDFGIKSCVCGLFVVVVVAVAVAVAVAVVVCCSRCSFRRLVTSSSRVMSALAIPYPDVDGHPGESILEFFNVRYSTARVCVGSGQ